MAESSITTPVIVSGLRVPTTGSTPIGPLRNLYQNKYVNNIFQFPSDLGASNRGHVITFTVQEQVESAPRGIQSDISIRTVAVQTARSAFSEAQRIVNLTPTQAAAEAAMRAKEGLDQAEKLFEEFISTLRTGPKRKDGDTVALYVPDTVNVQYSAQYSNDSLTAALGKPLFLAQAGSNIVDSLKTNQGAAERIKNVINDPFFRKLAAGAIDNTLGTNLTPFALSSVGYADNPQLQVLFSNVSFRTFQFSFILSPKNQAEASAIQNIIKIFKKASAPKFEPGFVTEQSIFLRVPDTFKIKFLFNGEENLNVNRIGECVLESIDVDYSPNGWSSFNDGSAIQTALTMQFREIFIIDKNRIEEGY